MEQIAAISVPRINEEIAELIHPVLLERMQESRAEHVGHPTASKANWLSRPGSISDTTQLTIVPYDLGQHATFLSETPERHNLNTHRIPNIKVEVSVFSVTPFVQRSSSTSPNTRWKVTRRSEIALTEHVVLCDRGTAVASFSVKLWDSKAMALKS